jgi:16S rRNA (cytidine1402-2'-O)-methyltransferase
MPEPQPATLYVVGTPLGNLEDISARAIRILREVDRIAAEDTRHTGRLLQALGVTTPQLSYHEHNRSQRTPEILERLGRGESLALVSDAGVPAISDPGQELVAAVAAAGFTVVPVAGPCAAIAALCASGLPTDRFAFEGFLPAKSKARREVLAGLARDTRTLVFYESPHRLRETLADLSAELGGDRPCALARELTKLHEEIWRGSLGAAVALYAERQPQGEYTLVIGGAVPQPEADLSEEQLTQELAALLRQGRSRSDASRELAERTGLPRKPIYRLALSLPDPEE